LDGGSVLMDGQTQRTRVLVVDDDENVLELLERKLEQVGFTVDVARSASGAREAAGRSRPEILLLGDVAVEGDGQAFADELLATAAPGAPPVVVVLSARSSVEDIEAALAHGADDYVLKPFSPRDLVHRLRVDLLRSRSSPGPGP
jgi:DNA-binding response OmpR family regulator